MATASDDFNRANETPLAGNWTNFGGNFNLATNAAAPASASSDANAVWNVFTPANDQFSQADLTVNGNNAGDQGLGFALRSSGVASPTQYRIVIDHGPANNVSITRYNTGTGSNLKQVTQTWSDGATWRVEITGYVISVFLSGSLVTSFDDSASGSKIASGKVGISFSSTETSASLDNWSGGDIAVAGGPVPNLYLNRSNLGW